MDLLELAKKVIEQVEICGYEKNDEGVKHELKNNKAVIDLKNYLESPQTNDKTDELMKYFTKVKVESGWLYNFWNTDNDDYADEWIFVPDMQVRCT